MQLEMHGQVRVNDYYWLNDRDNPDVIRYLEDENEYADDILQGYSGLQDRLLEEMMSRIPQQDRTAPYKHGDYFYYRRFVEGQDYPVYCRRKGSMQADEEVLLDVNKETEGHRFFSVRGFSVSPDHKTIGYGVDTVGRRFYDRYFIDLESGQKLDDRIADVTPYFEWSSDGQTVLYVRQDPQTLRWYQDQHSFGSAADVLVYEEMDDTFSAFLRKSLSGEYLYITSDSTTASEVRYIAAAS